MCLLWVYIVFVVSVKEKKVFTASCCWQCIALNKSSLSWMQFSIHPWKRKLLITHLKNVFSGDFTQKSRMPHKKFSSFFFSFSSTLDWANVRKYFSSSSFFRFFFFRKKRHASKWKKKMLEWLMGKEK